MVEEGWPCSIVFRSPLQGVIEEVLEEFAMGSVHDDAADERDPSAKGLVSSLLLELAVFELGLILSPFGVGTAHTVIG